MSFKQVSIATMACAVALASACSTVPDDPTEPPPYNAGACRYAFTYLCIDAEGFGVWTDASDPSFPMCAGDATATPIERPWSLGRLELEPTYDAEGRPTGLNVGCGLDEPLRHPIEYDEQGRFHSLTVPELPPELDYPIPDAMTFTAVYEGDLIVQRVFTTQGRSSPTDLEIDAEGYLARTWHESGHERRYVHDEDGNLIERRIKAPAQDWETDTFEYQDGRLVAMTSDGHFEFASGTATFAWDGDRLVDAHVVYDHGLRASQETTYDEAGRVVRVEVRTEDGELMQRMTRTYDAEGRVANAEFHGYHSPRHWGTDEW